MIQSGQFITTEQYYQVAGSCDRLLRRSDATLEWIALPWLHVLTEHPVYLAMYQDLLGGPGFSSERAVGLWLFGKILRQARASAYRVASLARNLLKAAAFANWRKAVMDANGGKSRVRPNSNNIDVVIVSWLVNVDHLQKMDDFYFGNLQCILADRGLSSILVLGNQSGCPTSAQRHRSSSCRRSTMGLGPG